jgi:hypothetical protein
MTRRHSIKEDEVRPLMRSLFKSLLEICETHENSQDAEPLFRLLWRLHQHRKGPPHFPDITPDSTYKLLSSVNYIFEN